MVSVLALNKIVSSIHDRQVIMLYHNYQMITIGSKAETHLKSAFTDDYSNVM